MSIYTISSNKVPISLLNFSRYSSLANICTSRPLYTWGLSLINPKVPSLGATIGYLSQQSTTISMEVFPLYKSICLAAANFFQENITLQFGTLTKLQATNEALFIGVLLYQAVAIPRTLFKVMKVPYTLFKAVVVPHTTLLQS